MAKFMSSGQGIGAREAKRRLDEMGKKGKKAGKVRKAASKRRK